ncbi:MAG: alanine dehydrogenase [Lentisphaerae bacterium GWF2_52_8]|nr:MAG: alanine dehydrogenase [Lentisphaerae bacterium GWF2_52_8]
MKIALAKEIKKEEYRVGLTPLSAKEYITAGHTVMVESGAGFGSGFSDDEYKAQGCQLTDNKKKLFDEADMVIKVKEPIEAEYELFHEGQILYTYLHLAADLKQTKALLSKKVKAVAYETVMEKDGSLPLLIPMSQIAGRLSVQEGAKYLEKSCGGRGILLGGVPGIRKGTVLIIGGGISGTNACKIAIGMGADVTIMDVSAKRLSELDDIFDNSIKTMYSNSYNIDEMIRVADLIIGAVLIPGAAAPKVIKKEDLKKMKKGSVIVDIAVDQGGCTETTRPTDHNNPTYIIDGVVHYCVANMPGAVSLSSTYALTSVTNRYGLMIANMGLEEAVAQSGAILSGINCYKGHLTNKPVAEAHGLKYEAYSGKL